MRTSKEHKETSNRMQRNHINILDGLKETAADVDDLGSTKDELSSAQDYPNDEIHNDEMLGTDDLAMLEDFGMSEDSAMLEQLHNLDKVIYTALAVLAIVVILGLLGTLGICPA